MRLSIYEREEHFYTMIIMTYSIARRTKSLTTLLYRRVMPCWLAYDHFWPQGIVIIPGNVIRYWIPICKAINQMLVTWVFLLISDCTSIYAIGVKGWFRYCTTKYIYLIEKWVQAYHTIVYTPDLWEHLALWVITAQISRIRAFLL